MDGFERLCRSSFVYSAQGRDYIDEERMMCLWLLSTPEGAMKGGLLGFGYGA
jgi:hypothetical protein